MIVTCKDCDAAFDDADRLTYCPHNLIMPEADLEQKKAALALTGHPVCFAHQPNGPAHRIQSVGWNGMVTLDDMVGEFAPHLFVTAAVMKSLEEIRRTPAGLLSEHEIVQLAPEGQAYVRRFQARIAREAACPGHERVETATREQANCGNHRGECKHCGKDMNWDSSD